MNPPVPRVVLPPTRRRDAVLGVGVGLALLATVLFGVISLARPHQSANLLSGVVVAREFTPQKEEQISFSKSRVTGRQDLDGEYVLQVRVEKEARIYAVPVEKAVYARKPLGANLEFVRPPSEQRH